MKLATVDIGTNTTLLLVAQATGSEVRVLADRAEITRLGRGIGGDGRLGREGIDRTLRVLEGYASTAAEHGAPIAAIGTEALRRAPNASDFLGPAAAILGTPVEVIDGEREAALSFTAAVRSFPREAAGAMVVVDIGGGSTEVIVSDAGAVRFRRSLPLGSVRLTERYVRHDPAAGEEVDALVAEVAGALQAVPFPGGAAVVGIAGTVTSLAAMALGLESYDASLVHGYRLSMDTLEALVERLRRSTQGERERMPGLDPKRADVILAGACILLQIGRKAPASHIIVSDRGIRWGLFYERLPTTKG